MRNGAAKNGKFGNGIKRLKNRGEAVIDASDRFRARRAEADSERAAAVLLPAWIPIQAGNRDAARPQASVGPGRDPGPEANNVQALRPRVEVDPKQVFILAKDEEVLDEIGVRCVPFTVLPAPLDPADDLPYLTPYLLRGWDCVLFQDPDDPDLPRALQRHEDPYRTFDAALEGLPAEERAKYRRGDYKLYHFVPDPLG